MPKKEVHIAQLQDFLPTGTYDPVLAYLRHYKVHLTVSRERKSVLGDYRHRTLHDNHRISVNGNLNHYAFLITLLHELAHLVTFEQFGNRVQAHGREWKSCYGKLLAQFLEHRVFPEDIAGALHSSLQNPAASSCAEDGLMRILRRYDKGREHYQLLEELPADALFRIEDGRMFRKGKKLRKRYQCQDVDNGKIYLFSPIYEVIKL